MRQKASAKLLKKEYKRLIKSIEVDLLFAKDGSWEPFLEENIRLANLIYPFRNPERLDFLLSFSEWFDLETSLHEFLPKEFAVWYLKRKEEIGDLAWEELEDDLVWERREEKEAIVFLLKSKNIPEKLRFLLSKRLSVMESNLPLNDREKDKFMIALGYFVAKDKKTFASEAGYTPRHCRNLREKYIKLIEKTLEEQSK